MRTPPLLAAWLALSLLAGCATPTDLVLPRQQAWVDGRRVDYVTTDISDAAMAADGGVNHVPRLADALGQGHASLTERVYKFPQGEQISIFASGPAPLGAARPDPNYSPLWRLVLVRWVSGASPRELRSEEALLAAEAAGELRLDVSEIVVNCPIVRAADGTPLRGVR